MTLVFDGRKFAREIEERLPRIKATLAVLLDPKNDAGVRYVKMKKGMADRLGIEMRIFDKPEIEKWNTDVSVNGIVIQLPFPNSDKLIKLIDPKKDVDGLREDSLYRPAVVRAILAVLGSLQEDLLQKEVCVVGSRGFVGRRLMRELRIPFDILRLRSGQALRAGTNYELRGVDKDDFDLEKVKKADVVISATGQAGLINGSMVKGGFVAIDVGYPKAEFTHSALLRASFFTPVPGGVGPVTVAMLFKNLLEKVHLRRLRR